MESMSINPGAAAIGSQLVDVASRALGSGAAALPSLTGLVPAGAEEVSMQAAMAFAAEAAAMLALNTAAQEELARTGLALTEIAQMYSQVDGEAAGTLAAGGARFASQAFAAGTGANVAAGPMQAETLLGAAGSVARTGLALTEIAQMYSQVDGEAAGTLAAGGARFASQAFAAGTGAYVAPGLLGAETLPGAAGSAARTPLLANLIEGVAASNPPTTVPAAANAASTVLGAGTAPLSSIGQVTSMGGAAGGGAAAGVPTSLTGEEESTRDESDHADDQQPGEQLL